MNVVFALVFFPLVLWVGVPFNEPVLDAPQKGSPAWLARVEEGTRVLAANGREVFDFTHIPIEVALSGSRPIDFEIVPPGESAPRLLTITPDHDEAVGFYRIGVGVAYEHVVRVLPPGGPAEQAGLRNGDLLLGVDGYPDALGVTQQYRLAIGGRDPIRVRIERDGESHTIEVVPTIEVGDRPIYGFRPHENLVAAVRESELARTIGVLTGDLLERVNGRPIALARDVLPALLAGRESTTFEVRRDGEPVRLEGPGLDEAEAVALDSDLYVAPDLESARITPNPGGPAGLAGALVGDRVLRFDQRPVSNWTELLAAAKRGADEGRLVTMTVERRAADGSLRELDFRMQPTLVSSLQFGFGLPRAVYVYRTHGLRQSLASGATASWRFLTDAWYSVKKMLTAELSPRNLGGIITIGKVSYDWSSQGWTKLLFFLCMLSVNLAFLNVLPIPLLDGGHLFFLLVEAVKGSPVSEKTLGYSQVVGLVLILSLMVYVTYQDVVRLF